MRNVVPLTRPAEVLVQSSFVPLVLRPPWRADLSKRARKAKGKKGDSEMASCSVFLGSVTEGGTKPLPQGRANPVPAGERGSQAGKLGSGTSRRARCRGRARHRSARDRSLLNEFLRAQQTNPTLARVPGQRHQFLQVLSTINLFVVLAGLLLWITLPWQARVLSLRERVDLGHTFKNAPDLSALPLQALHRRTRSFPISGSLIMIGCGIVHLAMAIEAHVWQGCAGREAAGSKTICAWPLSHPAPSRPCGICSAALVLGSPLTASAFLNRRLPKPA